MPFDPVLVEDTRAWLRKAAEDLRAAQHDRSAEPPLWGDMAFHAQQATEKALKAFLTWHDQPFRKTHDLSEIAHARAALDGSLGPFIRRSGRR